MDENITASEALLLLRAQGITVSDFTLYGWLESGKIKGFRLPSGKSKKPGRWRVNKDALYEFVKGIKHEG